MISVQALADELRGLPDAALHELLAARPDLVTPPPGDFEALAARLCTVPSALRAVESLDTAQLRVLEAVDVLDDPDLPAGEGAAPDGVDDARLHGLFARGHDTLDTVLAQLRDLLLIRRGADGWHLAPAVAEVVGPTPGGLGRPLRALAATRLPMIAADLGVGPGPGMSRRVSLLLRDPETVARLLDGAPEQCREVLDKLTAGHPMGRLPRAGRQVRAATAQGPVDWLLARGLLAPADGEHVELPREVGLALRGGVLYDKPGTDPGVEAREVSPRFVASAGAGAASEALRLVRELLEGWSAQPAAVLRSGGIGVRELRRITEQLEVDEHAAALACEVAYAAGLIGERGIDDPHWGPTEYFDEWTALPPAERWAHLARAWLGTTRTPSLVGTRDQRNAVRTPLADLDRTASPQTRRLVLDRLARLPVGAAADPQELLANLVWHRPRTESQLRTLAPAVLDEAAWLGITGLGALTDPGRELLAGRDAGAAAGLAALLPEPVHEVLLQADLTAVAPGPLDEDVARELAVLADVEGHGTASIYRFSEASLRRALDAGRSPAEIRDYLAGHSVTPLPQPLDYLLTDVGRQFGRAKVGQAGSYVRCDEPAQVSALLTDPRAEPLHLERIAPTVLVSPADPDELLRVLRDCGLSAVAEGAAARLPSGPEAGRPARRPWRAPNHSALRGVHLLAARRPDDDTLALVVSGLRAGSAAEAAPASAPAPVRAPAVPAAAARTDALTEDPTTVMALIREAASSRRRLWISIVDRNGQVHRHLLEPVSVTGGRIRAFDRDKEIERTFSVHHVAGVSLETPDY